jgi:hypothetical protein
MMPHKALVLVSYLKLWKFMEDFAKQKREKCSLVWLGLNVLQLNTEYA